MGWENAEQEDDNTKFAHPAQSLWQAETMIKVNVKLLKEPDILQIILHF